MAPNSRLISIEVYTSPTDVEANVAVDARKYAMDATFKICPYGNFDQLLIIYIEYIESVNIYLFQPIHFVFVLIYSFRCLFSSVSQTIPFIYVLMDRKTEECYTTLFEYIDANVLRCLF